MRRSLNKTGRYVRKPSKDPKSNELMEEHGVGYSSTGLVAQMREQGNAWRQGDVTVKLAAAYGYCWGVERAVRMAYEARNAFPDKRVHITNEIIHNPEVNQVRRRGGHAGQRAPAAGALPRQASGSPRWWWWWPVAPQAATSPQRCPRAVRRASRPRAQPQPWRAPLPSPGSGTPPTQALPSPLPAPPPPQRLRELDINIFEEDEGSKGKDYSSIKEGDVVIFPAFGATVEEMATFRDKGVQMVDTTCPWVAKVRARRAPWGWRGAGGCGKGEG